MKELVIRCTKMILVMDEAELIKNLPPDELEKAIIRGKGYKRADAVERRTKGGDYNG